jgi:hypothetical protein
LINIEIRWHNHVGRLYCGQRDYPGTAKRLHSRVT